MTATTPTRALGAQLSHMLKSRGVEVIFGIPGVHNQEMYRGIEEAGLTHVLARHEQGAGFMADGFARATGQPGICYVITGPGVCNIMTPMGQGYSDSVPMLVLSSCLDEVEAKKGQLHQMKDQETAAGTVCDWSVTAQTAEAAYALVDRALSEFQSKRARPKHIQVPIAQLMAQAEENWGLAQPDCKPMSAHPDDVTEVAELIVNAKRPLFIFGGGAQKADAIALVDAAGAIALTTYAGRGILGADHPMNVGSVLARPASADLIGKADLLIAVGTELAQVDIWRDQLGHDCPIVRVDIDPAQLADEHKAQVPVLADAADFTSALIAALSGHSANSLWKATDVSALQSRFRADVIAERPGIVPVADALREALPKDALIYSDMTQFAYAAKEVYPLETPGLWHHPYGFGTLGYALPAAIGGKIGVGDRAVVAIAGDYGFQYTLQELGVAVELGLSLPIILWDNGKLGEIEDSMVAAQIAPNAVIQRNPDFCKLADAYGAHTAKPASLGEFQSAVTAALSADGPTLIHMTADASRS